MRRSAVALSFLLLAGVGALVTVRALHRPAVVPAPAALPPGTEVVAVACFYPARTGMDLVEEVRQRPRAASPQDRLRGVIEELHRPPVSPAALPLFPAGSAPRAVFLSADGMACVDETAAAMDRSTGPRDEVLLVRALARSVIRACPEARTLVLLVDGAPRPRLALHLAGAGRWLLPRLAPPAR